MRYEDCRQIVCNDAEFEWARGKVFDESRPLLALQRIVRKRTRERVTRLDRDFGVTALEGGPDRARRSVVIEGVGARERPQVVIDAPMFFGGVLAIDGERFEVGPQGRRHGVDDVSYQARGDAERAAAAVERLGPAITPESLWELAAVARRKLKTEDGRYRRDHLRALAQRVEVGDGEIRIMGSKTEVL